MRWQQNSPRRRRCESHAIGVLRDRARRKHDARGGGKAIAGLFNEGNVAHAGEIEFLHYGRTGGCDSMAAGSSPAGFIASESENDGAIGRVAKAGEGQRAIKIDLDAR